MSLSQSMSIGILAYGSLINDPGEEICEATLKIINNVETPFCVEYARKSRTRGNAPTLVPVPCELGSKVNGVIFLLKENMDEKSAMDMLYRRERHKVCTTEVYNAQLPGDLRIECVRNFMGVDTVLYTAIKPNFNEILDSSLPSQRKAELLADAVIKSITPKTYSVGTDGISYLHDNMQNGIITPLTNPYREEILRRANHAQDLMEAHAYFASQKGLA